MVGDCCAKDKKISLSLGEDDSLGGKANVHKLREQLSQTKELDVEIFVLE
jgi:hypothetical protein